MRMVLILSFSHSWQGSTYFRNTGILKNCRPRACVFVKKQTTTKKKAKKPPCTTSGQINVATEQKVEVPTIPPSGLAINVVGCGAGWKFSNSTFFSYWNKCGFPTTGFEQKAGCRAPLTTCTYCLPQAGRASASPALQELMGPGAAAWRSRSPGFK